MNSSASSTCGILCNSSIDVLHGRLKIVLILKNLEALKKLNKPVANNSFK